MEETKAPAVMLSEDWSQLPWRKLEQHVYRLQKRIYQASCRGNAPAVHRLQQLLTRSQSARLLAVRRVTQDNQGKKTAGIDGKVFLQGPERLTLAYELDLKNVKKVQPVRRIWIPKPGKDEQRPLGIPTMKDRATQALAKMALEPEWEAKFEPNSYGFRPGRGCHDAIEAIWNNIKHRDKYVLDADIKGCFDNIDHEALLRKLSTYPAMRRLVRAWLKAGVMTGQVYAPVEKGTPQGGVISPLLANIALHGLEEAVTEPFRKLAYKPILVRYADDFVVLYPTKAGVIQAREIVEQWLGNIGLHLNPSKTRIVHTLNNEMGEAGFDFLGFHVRQYPVSKYDTGKNPHGKPLGFKTLIKPSKEAMSRHMDAIRQIVKSHQTAPQAGLIAKLTSLIWGWSYYYQTVNAKQALRKCDNLLYLRLRTWARRRHHNKSRRWVNRKYWETESGHGWRFQTPDGRYKLPKHQEIPIKRYTKVKGKASPYDGNLYYWVNRLKEHPLTTSKRAKLLKMQQGKCAICGLTFRDGDALQVDHLIPKSLGGTDQLINQMLYHKHCHDWKTARDGSHRKAAPNAGINDNDCTDEEPNEGKPSRSVLERRREEQSSRLP